MTADLGSLWVDPRGWVFVAAELGAEHGGATAFVCIRPFDPRGPIILPHWSPRVDNLQPYAATPAETQQLQPPIPYAVASYAAAAATGDATVVAPLKTWVANPYDPADSPRGRGEQ